MKIHFIWAAWEKLYRLNYNIPPMGILRVAGMTPPDIDAVFTDEMVAPVDRNSDADIIAISFLTPAAPHAYQLADHFRANGKYVVLGGTHTTLMPEEAGKHADTVVIGEAEGIWEDFISDFRSGRPHPSYRAPHLPDLGNLASVRRSLLPKRVYPYSNPVLYGIESMELSRGCTSNCAYCLVPSTQGPVFRNRPMEDVCREFDAVSRTDGILFFTDNNLLGNWSFTRPALEALVPHRKDWIGLMAPEDAARDPVRLELLLESGLCGIYGTVFAITGNEPPSVLENRKRNLRRLIEAGVVVIATFALGWDDHDQTVFERTVAFCLEAGLTVPEFIINTPFPGSRLFRQYREQNRLISTDWSLYNGNHAVFHPARMSAGSLEEGYHACYDQFYRSVDRDKALFDGFRDRVLNAMIRARRKQKETSRPPGH